MGIEYQSFEDFVEEVKALVAPETLAENLEALFRDQVGNALSDLQTLIEWLRFFNLATYTKSDVREFCAASIFDGPVGKITQVFAYKPGLDCRKYYYKRVATSETECWIERQRCVQCTFEPPPVNIYDTPYCNYVICGETACATPYLTSTEDDCKFKALDDDERIFSVGPDYKIYLAPRFPCDYRIFIQWQGIARKWLDTHLVPVDQQVREAVVNYVEAKIAKKERDFVTKKAYEEDYAISLRTLKLRYREEQEAELKRDCTAAIEQMLAGHTPLYDYLYPGCNAYVGGGNGDPAPDPEACTDPAAPTNLAATPPAPETTVTWTDNATNETAYQVRWRNITQDTGFTQEADYPPDTTTAPGIIIVGANDQDQIEIQVRAVNGECFSAWVSVTVTAEILN